MQSLLGKLVFLLNLFWLLSLMEHILVIKAAISPAGKNASFVKSLAEGLTVCKCLRHPPGVGREGGAARVLVTQPGFKKSTRQNCRGEREWTGALSLC